MTPISDVCSPRGRHSGIQHSFFRGVICALLNCLLTNPIFGFVSSQTQGHVNSAWRNYRPLFSCALFYLSQMLPILTLSSQCWADLSPRFPTFLSFSLRLLEYRFMFIAGFIFIDRKNMCPSDPDWVWTSNTLTKLCFLFSFFWSLVSEIGILYHP